MNVFKLFERKKKRVYRPHEATAADISLIGSKGSSLSDIFRLQLPVPQSFIITTEACNEFLKLETTEIRGSDDAIYISSEETLKEVKKEAGDLSDDLIQEVESHVHEIEKIQHRTFGGRKSEFPLLFSVRASPVVNQQSLFPTVLNLGYNDVACRQISEATGNMHYALDLYARFLRHFGTSVMGIDDSRYGALVHEQVGKRGLKDDSDFTLSDLQQVIIQFKAITNAPTDAHAQLKMAIAACFMSWNCSNASAYRKNHGIAENNGLAVVIQAMVYGNFNSRSGTGIAFTRNPYDGSSEMVVQFLQNNSGDDLLKKNIPTLSRTELADLSPNCHKALSDAAAKLENYYKNTVLIEFTIEDGHLYILEARDSDAEKSPLASLLILVNLVKEGILNQREALLRIDPTQLAFEKNMPKLGVDNFQQICNWADYFNRMSVCAHADSCDEVKEAANSGADGVTVDLTKTLVEFFKKHRTFYELLNMSKTGAQLSGFEDDLAKEIFKYFQLFPGRVIKFTLANFSSAIGDDYVKDINNIVANRTFLVAEIVELQCTSIRKAQITAFTQNLPIVTPEVIVSCIFTDHELELILPVIKTKHSDIRVGASLSVPRALLRADAIAAAGIDFIEIDTTSVTQHIFGFSASDCIMPFYVEKLLVTEDPFKTLDIRGVGSLIKLAIRKIRKANPLIKIGIAGNHCNDEKSVKFFDQIKCDYITANNIVFSKLAAAKSHIQHVQVKEQHEKDEYWTLLENAVLF